MTMCRDFNPDTDAQLDCLNFGHPFEAHAKPKRQMTIASFCAMTCAEGGFHKFLDEHFDGIYPPCETKEHAAEIVTTYCGVESRRELNTKGPEQELWLALQAQYKDWLRT